MRQNLATSSAASSCIHHRQTVGRHPASRCGLQLGTGPVAQPTLRIETLCSHISLLGADLTQAIAQGVSKGTFDWEKLDWDSQTMRHGSRNRYEVLHRAFYDQTGVLFRLSHMCNGCCLHQCKFKWEHLATAGMNLKFVKELTTKGIEAAALESVARPLAADAAEQPVVTLSHGAFRVPRVTSL